MSLTITQMLTEYAVNPSGLDTPAPRLTWKLASERRSQWQTAFRIIVCTTRQRADDLEADVWDSGKVTSGQSVHVAYGGPPLQSGKNYFWRVCVWDQDDSRSQWSETACWSMGLLHTRDWDAKWIGMSRPHSEDYWPPAYLRRVFQPAKPVRRAVVYATALGLYELYLGGERVGNDQFAPGWTDYRQRIQYQTYDVTGQIREGRQVIAAILGTGWYCGKLGFVGKRQYGYCPYLLAKLQIEYEDGTSEAVVTDETWKVSAGPLLYSEIYRGEACDARLELTGWLNSDYDDSEWESPIELPYKADQYGGKLVAQADPPVRVIQEIKPVSIRKTARGTYLFDMGQNMVGNVRLIVQGERGTKVTLDHAEILDEDGNLYKRHLRGAVQTDAYILKGEGIERYEPKFTYHGFRYVEVTGFPGEPDLHAVTGRVIHNDAPVTGKLTTSHPMINQLQSNIVWGQKGNFFSVPTDCPQRDERMGWSADAMIFSRTSSFNMEVARFYTKYITDLCDAQWDSGSFPNVAPDCGYYSKEVRKKKGTEWIWPYEAGWADAGVLLPWTIYQVYGDQRVLENSYPALVSYMGFLNGYCENDLMPVRKTDGFGDWLSVYSDTPKHLIASAFFAYSTAVMSRIAEVLGKEEDAGKYRERAERIKRAFRSRYVLPDGKLEGDTQTAYALALGMDLLTGEQAAKAASHLVNDIRKRGNRLSTGFLGTGYLLPALSRCGYSDVAYDLLLQEAFPSWFYQIRNGATTMWERWDGYTKEWGIHPDKMNSFNHYAYGAVGEWLYRFMAGIEFDEEQPGYKHIILRPEPGKDVSEAHAEYESMYGRIVSSWWIDEGIFHYRIAVPVNTTATVCLPPGDQLVMETEEGQEESIRALPAWQGRQRLQVGSGTYAFSVRLNDSCTALYTLKLESI